ncbi:GP107-like protein [Mya arenaria]|uniref:GP107-like protein n=1 Tax=Mya arenaria TaxID=6604 RepID=A0ABY7GBT3_MYAAR|nr:GP107-like protein [Mya arenaria]
MGLVETFPAVPRSTGWHCKFAIGVRSMFSLSSPAGLDEATAKYGLFPILDNIAWIIVEESEEGQAEYTTWKQIFILIDLLCCGAILFPVVWYVVDQPFEGCFTCGWQGRVVCYIYFTRIIVFLLKMTVPFKYEWLDEFFKELATITFFMVTGYKFKPATDNPYLQVPSDDEEDIEMDTVIVGQQGALDTVKRVNQAYNDETTSTGLKVRESSHEYD